MFKTKYFTHALIIFLILFLAACGSGGGSVQQVPSSGNSSNGGTGGTTNSSASLTWNAPQTRADGSPLNPATDLQSYKIYYGTASGTYTHTITIANPGTTVITYILNLPSGTYYVAVSDVDILGQESSHSNEISKTI